MREEQTNMDFDTFVTIVCAIGTVVAYIAYRYFSENVYLTYKEQRIPQNKKGAKR